MAGKGDIAHHGYQRPYKAGYQTGSCLGTHYSPYEVSCDRLKEVIEMVKRQIATWEQDLKELLANPPAVLIVMEGRSSWGKEERLEYQKPEDFDSRVESYKSRIPRTYECAYDGKMRDIRRSINFAKIDLATMERRLAEWVPPVQV